MLKLSTINLKLLKMKIVLLSVSFASLAQDALDDHIKLYVAQVPG